MTEGVPPGRRPTLQDVAAHAGVSRALVSVVLRGAPGAGEQARQRVLAAAAELGYRPDPRAQLLARRRSRLLGVMFGAHQPFHADLLEGTYLAADQTGYDLALSALTPSRDEHRAIESLLDYRCEALILFGPQTPESRLAVLGRQLPVVVIARQVRDSSVHVVRTADEKGARQAVEYLAGLGHQQIVHLDGGRAPGAAERRRGYRTTMRRHGLGEHIRIIPGGMTEDSGSAAAQVLRESPGSAPTAIVAFNDRCAVGLLDAFIRAGIAVPADVSIVGYDDDRLSRSPHINLTTVRQDASRMAKLALDTVVACLDGNEADGRDVVIPPELVIRGTTARPPAAGGSLGTVRHARGSHAAPPPSRQRRLPANQG